MPRFPNTAGLLLVLAVATAGTRLAAIGRVAAAVPGRGKRGPYAENQQSRKAQDSRSDLFHNSSPIKQASWFRANAHW